MTSRGINNTYPVAPRRRHERMVIGIALAAMVLATIIVVRLFAPDAPTPASGAIPAPEAASTPPSVVPEAVESKPDVVGDDFWEDMLESTECELETGYGPASNTAAMLGPTDSEPAGGGAAFRVIDDTGILFEGELPFKPSRTWLGRHLDGRVLVGFSHLRLNSEVRRDPSSPEPVVVYQDGEKIYQTDKAWSFDVASDGSAFFTVEPEPDDTSNLIVRDIDGAVVRTHDLEYRFTSHDDEPPFHAGFTNDGDEVMLRPSSLEEDHLFYPVGGGKPRVVQYQGEGILLGGVLASSKVGFYVYRQGPDEPLLAVREQFNWDSSTESVSEVWTTEVDLDYFSGIAHLSSDDRYLLLSAGGNTHLLDAETGRVLFAHPTVENLGRKLRDAPNVGKVTAAGIAYRKADRERLASVMDVDEGQDIGAIRSYGFRDGDLYIYREVGLEASRQCASGYDDLEGRNACMEHLRASGAYSEVLDLFDLASIQIDSQPDRRITIDRSKQECRPGPESGLALDDDALRYVGRED